MQDATPLTLGEEWSGYVGMLSDSLGRIEDALKDVYSLAIGGTAVGTGINAAPGFGEAAAGEVAKLTNLPFISAPNKFAGSALASRSKNPPEVASKNRAIIASPIVRANLK